MKHRRAAAATAAVLTAAAWTAACAPAGERDVTRQRGAWDVEVTSVADPYRHPAAAEVPGRRTVLVRFTATNVTARAQTFTTATTLGLADADGGWFERVPDVPWAGLTSADRPDVPPGAATSGAVMFSVRDSARTRALRLVIGREMAIRPVGGIPPTAYVVPLPVP